MTHRLKAFDRAAALGRVALRLAVALLAASPLAAETRLPEEELFERYLEVVPPGSPAPAASATAVAQLEAIRTDFARLLDERLEMLRLQAAKPLTNRDQLALLALAHGSALRALELYQSGEVYLRELGGATPAATLESMLLAQESIHQDTQILVEAARALAVSPAEDDWRVRDVAAASERTTRSLERTALFLRGTGRAQARVELLEQARRSAAAAFSAKTLEAPPADLAELDRRSPDLRGVFGLPPTLFNPPSPSKSDPSAGLRRLDAETPLARFVERFVHDLLAAEDPEFLKADVGAALWERDPVSRVRAECPGCLLRSVDELWLRQLPDGRLAARIGELRLVDAGGAVVETRFDLLLERRGDGFVVVEIGRAARRIAETEAE